MDDVYEDHLLIQIIRYGLRVKRFTLLELLEQLKMTPEDFEYAKKLQSGALERANENHVMYIFEAKTNPNISNSSSMSVDHSINMLLPSAVKYYTEHLEIRMARESATDAKRQAQKANRVAMGAVILTFIFGVIQLFVSTPIIKPKNKPVPPVVKEEPHRDNIDI